MYVDPLPLSVDVMWTCRFVEVTGILKLMVVVFDEYNVAVASSNGGGTDRSETGCLTMNSISFLISALKDIVGNAMVHWLFGECS